MMTAADRVTQAWKDHWNQSQSRGDHSLRGRLLRKYIAVIGGFSSSRHILKIVLKRLPPLEGCSILDAGCGTGLNSLPLSHRGAHVTLLDIAPLALTIAKEFYDEAGLKAEYVEGSIFAMPFADATFDVVWNTGVIEHFETETRRQAVNEMLRVLKPNGTMITLNPSADAKIYRYAKARGEELGTWDVGVELPIETLKHDVDPKKFDVVEWREGWFMQLHFLKYAVPRPLRLAYVIAHEFAQNILGFLNRWPGYLIISEIKHRPTSH